MITTLIEREAEPILISDLTWREFKAVEQLIVFVQYVESCQIVDDSSKCRCHV